MVVVPVTFVETVVCLCRVSVVATCIWVFMFCFCSLYFIFLYKALCQDELVLPFSLIYVLLRASSPTLDWLFMRQLQELLDCLFALRTLWSQMQHSKTLITICTLYTIIGINTLNPINSLNYIIYERTHTQSVCICTMILYLFVFVLCTIYQNDPKGNSLNYSQFSSNILSQMKDYKKN